MNTPEQEEKSERAYQQAMEIIDQEWLAAGKTREELDQEKKLVALYDILLSLGYSDEKIDAEWENKTNVEILCAYGAPIELPSHAPAKWKDMAACIGQSWKSDKAAADALAEVRG